MKFDNEKQASAFEELMGTHGLDYDTANRIAIETNGDMDKALLEIAYLKLTKKKSDQ